MNRFRSTERSLTILKFKQTRTNGHSGCNKSSYRHQSNSFGNSTLESIQQAALRQNKKSFNAACLRGPRIKLFDLSKYQNKILKRQFTTSTRISKSLDSNSASTIITTKTETTTTVSEAQDKLSFSISNPGKPNAEDVKDLILEPLPRPLTNPRFTKTPGIVDCPSVTRVLSATMPAASVYVLDKWRQAMIKKLGLEGFNQYKKDTFERGRILHALLADHLMRSDVPIQQKVDQSSEIVNNLWKSIQKIISDKISNVRLIEHTITHSDVKYRGIVDCVAHYENELAVIDFKTSEKVKKNVDSLYDNPIQVAAYCGAINNDASIPTHVIDRNICFGVVIVAYTDGSEATAYPIRQDKICNEYWKQWLTRLDQYSRMEQATRSPSPDMVI